MWCEIFGTGAALYLFAKVVFVIVLVDLIILLIYWGAIKLDYKFEEDGFWSSDESRKE